MIIQLAWKKIDLFVLVLKTFHMRFVNDVFADIANFTGKRYHSNIGKSIMQSIFN